CRRREDFPGHPRSAPRSLLLARRHRSSTTCSPSRRTRFSGWPARRTPKTTPPKTPQLRLCFLAKPRSALFALSDSPNCKYRHYFGTSLSLRKASAPAGLAVAAEITATVRRNVCRDWLYAASATTRL